MTNKKFRFTLKKFRNFQNDNMSVIASYLDDISKKKETSFSLAELSW